MSAKRYSFQYALLRYVHDAVTGEFLNIGLVMFSKSAGFFHAQLLTQYRRITGTFPNVDGEFYQRYARRLQVAFDRLTAEISTKQSSMFDSIPAELDPILQLILPKDDSAFQFSDVRGGATDDLNQFFDALYSRTVTQYLDRPDHTSRTDEDVWSKFRKPLQVHRVTEHLGKHVIETPYGDLKFDHALKNGVWHVMEPTSLDLSQPESIKRKVFTVNTQAQLLHDHASDTILHILLGKPLRHDDRVQRAYTEAHRLLREHTKKIANIEIIDEDEAEAFALKMQKLAGEHVATG